MISNIIELGKNVDVVPYAETVDSDQEIVEMIVDINEEGKLYLQSSEIVQKEEKNIYLISPTKAINRGKNTHFYPHDFTLSKSFIKENGSDKSIPGINKDKVFRNYDKTEGFEKKLELSNDLKEFIESFYDFVKDDNSEFIQSVFDQNKSFISDLSKKDFSNLVFSYVLSDKVISKFNLSVNHEKEYYYLGEITEITDLINNLKIFETLEDTEEGSKCSFCNTKNAIYAPFSATIYFSFAKNPKNVFYNLDEQNADKHLLICKDCYKNYNIGRKFMENHLKNNLIGSSYFSVFELDGESKQFKKAMKFLQNHNIEKIYRNDDLKELRNNLEDTSQAFIDLGIIGEENSMGVSMFFYEYDKGYRVLKTIKDLYPDRILDLVKENDRVNNFSFNAFIKSFFRDKGKDSYDLLEKWKLDLFEKMLLNIPINYDSLVERFNEKASYKLRNSQDKYRNSVNNFSERFLSFLELLNRLECEIYSYNNNVDAFNGVENTMDTNSINQLEGKTGQEKLENFLDKNKFMASLPEIKAGIPLGITIRWLSKEINNYDKRMLGFARKRINDKDSLKKYVNEIEEKVLMHEMGNQWNVKYFSEQLVEVLEKESFSKDDFILGMFTGYSLAYNFTNEKSDQN